MADKEFTCSICGHTSHGYGNNAWPYNDGCCCDACNSMVVIPLRLIRDPNLRAEAIKKIQSRL